MRFENKCALGTLEMDVPVKVISKEIIEDRDIFVINNGKGEIVAAKTVYYELCFQSKYGTIEIKTGAKNFKNKMIFKLLRKRTAISTLEFKTIKETLEIDMNFTESRAIIEIAEMNADFVVEKTIIE